MKPAFPAFTPAAAAAATFDAAGPSRAPPRPQSGQRWRARARTMTTLFYGDQDFSACMDLSTRNLREVVSSE